MIYTLTVILLLIGAAASAIMVIAVWAQADRFCAVGDGDNGQVKAASAGGLFHFKMPGIIGQALSVGAGG